jgi:hypothetical protein
MIELLVLCSLVDETGGEVRIGGVEHRIENGNGKNGNKSEGEAEVGAQDGQVDLLLQVVLLEFPPADRTTCLAPPPTVQTVAVESMLAGSRPHCVVLLELQQAD